MAWYGMVWSEQATVPPHSSQSLQWCLCILLHPSGVTLRLIFLALRYASSRQVSSIAAHDAAVTTGAMAQILLWVSAFECISSVAVVQMLDGSGRAPGSFGFDPLSLYSKPELAAKKVGGRYSIATCI